MEIIIKAAAAALVGCVLALLLKKNTAELTPALTLAVGLLTAGLCAGIADEIMDALSELAERGGVSAVLLRPVCKCVGIGVVSELGAELCRDAGQGAIASFVELCGTLCALFCALPLISSLTAVVEKLL